jgi:hypothetical protein
MNRTLKIIRRPEHRSSFQTEKLFMNFFRIGGFEFLGGQRECRSPCSVLDNVQNAMLILAESKETSIGMCSAAKTQCPRNKVR